MTKKIFLTFVALEVALFAHVGVHSTSGFAAGFSHPIGGLDHILAMVAVGLWAAQMRGKAIFVVPATFVAMMAIAALFGLAGAELPMIEEGILASVFVLGALVAFGVKLPMVVGAVIVGLLAIFHGHAHGAEMPLEASAIGYSIGFVLATALLHAVGIALVISAERYLNAKYARVAGGAVVAGGLFLALA